MTNGIEYIEHNGYYLPVTMMLARLDILGGYVCNT